MFYVNLELYFWCPPPNIPLKIRKFGHILAFLMTSTPSHVTQRDQVWFVRKLLMIFQVWAKIHFIWFSDFNQEGEGSFQLPSSHLMYLTSMKEPMKNRVIAEKKYEKFANLIFLVSFFLNDINQQKSRFRQHFCMELQRILHYYHL